MNHAEPQAITPASFERFGELLRYLRLRARLTQRELSIAVGYNFAQISRLESGQRLPDPAVIRAVFIPALDLDAEPAWAQRLLGLAEGANRQALERNAAARPVAPSLAEATAPETVGAVLGDIPLLTTKLYIPQARPSVVLRPRLLRQLSAALTVPLTLVVAGAGFGKTTLLASWLQKAERRAQNLARAESDGADAALSSTHSAPRSAWLSLDAADNDQAIFLRYLVAALQTLQPGVGRTTLTLLQLAQPPAVPALLTPLLNELADLSEASLIVLDDYHVLTAPAIHDALLYLVNHLPPAMHLILASRVEPPLPLARLRARGAMLELRAADLRFTPDESFALLHDALGAQVTPEQAGVLEARTEGWAAGLQLAALALRGRMDTNAFLDTFTGGNRYIADYLATEVLEQLPAHVRAFVLQTAALDRFCAPLCDAVLGIPPDGAGPVDVGGNPGRTPLEAGASYSQVVLAELEQAQLFLIPLDDERRWYRYHHLFAEMLRARLRGGARRAELGQLHQRAAAWFEQAALIDEAIVHALAASELEAALLVARHAGRMVAQGNLVPLRRWLDQLPAGLVQATPRLAIAGAMIAVASGDAMRGEALLSAARASAAPATAPADWLDQTQEAADLIEITLARAEGEWRRAYELAEVAVTKPLAGDQFLQAWARWELGVAALQCDRVGEARAIFAGLLIDVSPELSGLWLQAAAGLGRAMLLQADCRAAAQLYALALEQAAAGASRSVGQIHLGLAALHYAQGDLTAAETHAYAAQALGADPPNALTLIAGATWLARIALARGDAAAARAWMDQTHALRPELLQPFLLALIVDELVQAQLGVGALHQAQMLLSDGELALNAAGRLVVSRLALASGDAEQAATVAGRLAEESTAQRMGFVAIEALLVRAQAVLALGRPEETTLLLTAALRLALPEQLVQPFRDAGPAVPTLLEALGRDHPEGALRAFVGRVFAT